MSQTIAPEKIGDIVTAADLPARAGDYYTPEDNAWFVNTFARFVAGAFPERLFTERFYKRLNSRFGHIANFNRHGFWFEWFSTTERKVDFLQRTISPPWYCHFQEEQAIQAWLAGTNYLERWEAQLEAETTATERAQYEQLKARYGQE
jgi:hypothetical protein